MSNAAQRLLSQTHRIDQRINAKLAQADALRELAEKTSAILTGTSSAQRAGSRLEEVVTRIVDLQADIARDIDALLDVKCRAMDMIRRLPRPEYQTVLELRYLCFKKWEEIAEEMGVTHRHVFYLHRQALRECRE